MCNKTAAQCVLRQEKRVKNREQEAHFSFGKNICLVSTGGKCEASIQHSSQHLSQSSSWKIIKFVLQKNPFVWLQRVPVPKCFVTGVPFLTYQLYPPPLTH